MRRNRSPKWTPTILFFLVWLGASVTPLSAQNIAADQVWDQLQARAYTMAQNEGFKQVAYMVGWLNKGGSYPWRQGLLAGRSYLIVGVCDDDCADVDLALEDVNNVVIASDTAADDLPVIRLTPSTTANYWVKATMHDCSAVHCGYGNRGLRQIALAPDHGRRWQCPLEIRTLPSASQGCGSQLPDPIMKNEEGPVRLTSVGLSERA